MNLFSCFVSLNLESGLPVTAAEYCRIDDK